ncbi:MAG TPA: hypothetical protein VL463_06695 [Kofleriaceae bacterium]|nr:hypothetical protein [Kofleriaceae bacterium]
MTRFVLALAILLCAPAALAQTPAKKPPSQKQLDQARAHFKAAEAAKAKKDFQTAAVEYLAAYELFEDPEFFFDTAEVYKLAGDEPNALTYYEKYLELDPTGRGAAAAKAAADELRRSIAAKQDAARKAADEAAAKKAADDAAAKKAADDAAALKKQQDEQQVVAPVPSPSSPGKGLRVAGLATGAVGVVSLGVGIAFGAKASSISDELSKADTFDQARYQEGKDANRNMYVFTGVGAAALVAGGVLYYLGSHATADGEAPAVTFAPMIDSQQITFTAAGRF